MEGEVQQNGDNNKPPAELTVTIRHVERLCSFVKTAHSLQELDSVCFENGCSAATFKSLNFNKMTLRCKTVSSRRDKRCPFVLLAWRSMSAVGDNTIVADETKVAVHVYVHGKHNHKLNIMDDHKQLLPDASLPVSSFFTSPAAGRREWTFVETVEHLLHQLDKLERKYNCVGARLKQMERQKKICGRILCCANKRRSRCKFALMIRNTDKGRSHLYSTGKHKCSHKNMEKNAKYISMSLTPSESEEINEKMKQQQQEEEEEQNANAVNEPPPSVLSKVVRNVKRRYIFLKTVHSLQELYSVVIEHQCSLVYIQRNSSTFQNVHLRCYNMQRGGNCPFALLVWRPNKNVEDPIHVYMHNKHNHIVKPADQRAMNRMPKHVLWSDSEKPPARFTTPNGREWFLVETVGSSEHVEECRRKFNCYVPSVGGRIERQSRTTMFCSGKCAFLLLAQKTDRGRYHIYRSSTHTCRHKEENLLSQYAVLPDAHPPISIATRGAQQWTFVETVKAEKETRTSLAIMARKIGRKYHCVYPNIKELKTRRFVCRMRLLCTAYSGTGCRFQMLAQKTGQGRFHLYVSGEKHTCLHRNGGINRRRIKKEKEEAMWEKEEKQDEIKVEEDEDKIEEDEKEEQEYVEDETEEMEEGMWENEDGIEDEEEENETSENEMAEEEEDEKDAEEEEIEEDDKDQMEEEWEAHDEDDEAPARTNINNEEKDCEEKDEEREEELGDGLQDEEEEEYDEEEDVLSVRSNNRSPTVPHEINDVQFVDFVDHPKSEGVKMRLLREPKKELEASDAITLNEEEPINNVNRKIKIPKPEALKEEAQADEDEPGPSNTGEQRYQQQENNRKAALRLAVINRQNHHSVRHRWWVEPLERNGAEARINEKRLLRERKCLINYRE